MKFSCLELFVIILLFFTFYVSSGMVAAGVFFESSFGADYLTGMLIVGGITILYTLFGGFLGASLTDVAQGILMFAALIVVPIVAVINMGGVGETIAAIEAVDPARLNILTGGTALGIISAAAWGLGYFGQPHIIVRFMALRNPQEATAARRIGISWMMLTCLGAISTGLIGIGYFAAHPEVSLDNPETVFLVLSQILFHPFVAGLVLAAVLAAIMSTISSQLIVTSSALVEDLYKIIRKKEASENSLVMFGRMGVLVVAVVAILIALDRNSTILELVGFAWAGFGASFGPIVLLALFWKKLTNWGAIAGLATSAATVFIWGNLPIGDVLYEIIPGFAINLIVTIVVSLLTYKRNDAIELEFDRAVELARPGRRPRSEPKVDETV